METKPYLFTYIIAYKHRADRIHNLKRVLEWLIGFTGIEIIIIEQDRSPKLHTFSLRGVKHIYTKSDLPFNKAWAFNVGLKYSTTGTIVFGDCDIIMDAQEFINGLKSLQNFECVSPYNRVIDLNQNEIHLTIDQMKGVVRPGRGETDIQKICLCGGIIMFRKDAIIKIGGWDQQFISWGGEDDYQSFKSKMFLTWTELPANCYHLWHDRGAPDQKWYNRNLQLLNKLISFSIEDTKKYIGTSMNKIGFKNSYCDK